MPAFDGQNITRTTNGAGRKGRVGVYDATSSTSPAQVEEATGATQPFAGVYTDAFADGEGAVLQRGGTAICIAGAAVANVATALTADSAGRLVAASSGNQIYGYNVTTASAADDEFEVDLVWHPGLTA